MGQSGHVPEDRMVLLILRERERTPAVDEAASELAIDPAAFDRDFGVVLLDHDRGLWCVRVKRDALPADLGANAWIASDVSIRNLDQFPD